HAEHLRERDRAQVARVADRLDALQAELEAEAQHRSGGLEHQARPGPAHVADVADLGPRYVEVEAVQVEVADEGVAAVLEGEVDEALSSGDELRVIGAETQRALGIERLGGPTDVA